MFYLISKTIEEIQEGDTCMVLADFSGIKAGTKGVITENYKTGVMVTWEANGFSTEAIKTKLEKGEMISAGMGFVSDGFGDDELEYLAFQTEKHPSKTGTAVKLYTAKEIEDLIHIPCCHTSGIHDPMHFQERKYICADQTMRALEDLCIKLKINPVTKCDPDCGWCKDYHEKKAGEGFPLFKQVPEEK